MIPELRISLFIGLSCFLLLVLQLLKKHSLNLRYTLAWLLSGVAMLMAVLFPGIPTAFARLIGIIEPVNAVFLLQGLFVMLILLSLTAIVSHLNEKNKVLVQNIALLEQRLRQMEQNLAHRGYQEE